MSAIGYMMAIPTVPPGRLTSAGGRRARSWAIRSSSRRRREASSVRSRLRGLTLVLGAVGVVASLGLPLEARGAGPGDPAPELGRAAPEFTLPDLAGKSVRLGAFRGNKAVLLNFWATWCPPCREEMPTLERLSAARRGTIEVLGIGLDTVNAAKVRAFVRELGITFPILLDPDLAVGTPYRVRGLPTSFVLDRGGIVRFREIGYRNWMDRESQFVLEEALRPR